LSWHDRAQKYNLIGFTKTANIYIILRDHNLDPYHEISFALGSKRLTPTQELVDLAKVLTWGQFLNA
jgi:hypothetical protein